jgi:hypothetical protein
MGRILKTAFLSIIFCFILFQSAFSEDDLILKEIDEIKNDSSLSSYSTSKLAKHLINSQNKKYKEALNRLIQQLEEKSPNKVKEYWPLYISQRVLDKNTDLTVAMQKVSDLDPYDGLKFYIAMIEAIIIDQLEKIKNKKIQFKVSKVIATPTNNDIDQKSFEESERIFIDYYLSLIQSSNQSNDLQEKTYIAFVSNQNKFNKLLESIILKNEPINILQSDLNKYIWGASCGTGSGGYHSAQKSAQALLDLEGQSQQEVLFDLILSSQWDGLSPITEERIFQLCVEIIQQQSIDHAKALTGMHLLNPNNTNLSYVSFLTPELSNKILINIASLDPQKHQEFEAIKSDVWKIILNSFIPKVEDEDGVIIFKSSHRGRHNIEDLKLTKTNKEQWLVLAESMSTKESNKTILETITEFYINNKVDSKLFLQKMLQSENFHGKFIAAGKLKAMGIKVNDQEFSPLKFKLSINSAPLVNKNIQCKFVNNSGSTGSDQNTDLQGVLELNRDKIYIHTGKVDYLELTYIKKFDKNAQTQEPQVTEAPSFPGGSFFYLKVDDPSKIIDTVDLNFLAYSLNIKIDSSEIPDFNPKEMYLTLSFIKDREYLYDKIEVVNQSVPYLENFQFNELCSGNYKLTIKIADASLYENTFEIVNGANLNIKLKRGYTLKYTLSLPIKSDESHKYPSLSLINPKQNMSFNYDYQNKKFDNLQQGEYLFSFIEDTLSNYDSERNLYEGYQQTFTITADSPPVIDLGVIELKQKVMK